MGAVTTNFMRQQLVDRRERIGRAVGQTEHPARLHELLAEVDDALARIDEGSFGICEECHEPIEEDRLICDPLIRFCLGHLTIEERDALERDLELAARVQQGLLPRQNLRLDGWHVCYHYEPASVVSGDYCDVIDAGPEGIYFMAGDVSGKGVAASMLMAHLHAMFRALISVQLPLQKMIQHASRVFKESTLPSQYATLVCGRAMPDGMVELCNAGHPAPLVVRNGTITPLEVSDLPFGLFADEEFSVTQVSLARGDGIVIYSDGVSEATDASGSEYSWRRLARVISDQERIDAPALIGACRDDLAAFRAGARAHDDVTLFILGRDARAVGDRSMN